MFKLLARILNPTPTVHKCCRHGICHGCRRRVGQCTCRYHFVWGHYVIHDAEAPF